LICVSCKESCNAEPCQRVIKIALESAVARGKITATVAIRTAEHMAIRLEPSIAQAARAHSQQ